MTKCPVCQSYLINNPNNTDILMCPSCTFRTYAKEKITKAEILMGREVEYPLSEELEENLTKLHYALNVFRAMYRKPMVVSSGYRPGDYNKKAGGGGKSAHLSCEACDFKDSDGELDKWCEENLYVLESIGLWLENPEKTEGWCHLQTRAAKSGRVFNP